MYKAGERESKYKGVQRGQREKRLGREDETMRASPERVPQTLALNIRSAFLFASFPLKTKCTIAFQLFLCLCSLIQYTVGHIWAKYLQGNDVGAFLLTFPYHYCECVKSVLLKSCVKLPMNLQQNIFHIQIKCHSVQCWLYSTVQ